jgi:hypothetical protein
LELEGEVTLVWPAPPVLLIHWRRPYLLKEQINRLRAASVSRIYLFCDGQPDSLDAVVESTHSAILRAAEELREDGVFVETRLSSHNLGCEKGVRSAIDWFFEAESEGVILEDDCLPGNDFIPYAAELLDRYRDDVSIFSISGENSTDLRFPASYGFMSHPLVWGWASWRRAWRHYHEAEQKWLTFRDAGHLDDVFRIPQESRYWREHLDGLFNESNTSVWDYQWWLSSWMNHGLHVWPNSCLVTNIGFNSDGTHTIGDSCFSSLTLEPLGKIRHPEIMVPSRDADEFAFLFRREGLSMIEFERYGRFYYWMLRFRQLRTEGYAHYFTERARKILPFLG